MSCRHLWIVLLNFQQWNEHRLCMNCGERILRAKLNKREK